MTGKQAFFGALGHLTGRAMRRSHRLDRRAIPLWFFDVLLTRRFARLPKLSPEQQEQICSLLDQTEYWHGSGRFQYRGDDVIDLLQIVASSGTLEPQLDNFDAGGPMQSLSLAPARIYARAYADVHRTTKKSPGRYGNAAFWAAMYLGDSGLVAAQEVGSYRKAKRQVKASGSRTWHQKTTKTPTSLVGTFREGSDIPGNYPILYGVSGITLTKTSRAIAAHEVRTLSPILLAKHVTHIEVPRTYIPETSAFLHRYGRGNIPVVALEDFESYARTQPYSLLFAGTNQRRGVTRQGARRRQTKARP